MLSTLLFPSVSTFVYVLSYFFSILGLTIFKGLRRGLFLSLNTPFLIGFARVYVSKIKKKAGMHYIFMSLAVYSVLLSDLWECIV